MSERERPALIRPPALHVGDRIRVVSPSLPSLAFATQTADTAEAALGSMGFVVDYGQYARELSDDGWSAGSPAVRAADLMNAFRDPEVAGVMSAAGGGTSRDLLPLLDASVMRENPKAFIGRSDNTYLNAFLLDRAGLSSFNGVAFMTQFGHAHASPETFTSAQLVLLGDEDVRYRSSPHQVPGTRVWERKTRAGEEPHAPRTSRVDTWLRPGFARGRLVGGEIDIVRHLLELDMMDMDRAVLWLDVRADAPSGFAESIEHIVRLSGSARPCGIMVAHDLSVDARDWLRTVEHGLRHFELDEDTPVLVGGDIGHHEPAWLLPYGEEMILDSSQGVVWPRTGYAGSTHEKTKA